jgi:hypothetical protein
MKMEPPSSGEDTNSLVGDLALMLASIDTNVSGLSNKCSTISPSSSMFLLSAEKPPAPCEVCHSSFVHSMQRRRPSVYAIPLQAASIMDQERKERILIRSRLALEDSIARIRAAAKRKQQQQLQVQLAAIKPAAVKQRLSVDEECSICFLPMSDRAETTFCRKQCGRSVHSKCFSKWIAMSNSKQCILCRSDMFV